MLVRSFLSAGVDTTVSGISFALANLATDAEQWDLLRHDGALARNAFEETIRRESPVIGFFRTTSRSTTDRRRLDPRRPEGPGPVRRCES